MKHFSYAGFWFWGCLWSCLFGLLPALAQEAGEAPGLQELREDMRRLESQLEALRLEPSSPSSQSSQNSQNSPGAAPLPGTSPPSRTLFLGYQQRLADFEQAFARLTAQVEGLEQRLARLERALERLANRPPPASAAPPSPSPASPAESATGLVSETPSEPAATPLLPELASEAGGLSSGAPEPEAPPDVATGCFPRRAPGRSSRARRIRRHARDPIRPSLCLAPASRARPGFRSL